VLLFVVAVVLVGCGGSQPTEESVLGTYELSSSDDPDFKFVLRKNGIGEWWGGGKLMECRWTLKDGEITLRQVDGDFTSLWKVTPEGNMEIAGDIVRGKRTPVEYPGTYNRTSP
jgi:major membrane immunogen (membrane-anchored lipoprotein)